MIQIIRGGKAIEVGKTERLIKLGNSSKTELPREARPIFIGIWLDENSQAKRVETRWNNYDVSPAGERVVEDLSIMTTNKKDLPYFDAALSPILNTALINGYVRAILGFNYQPVYGANGDQIADTAYNTQAPASGDYLEYGADGTAIKTKRVENEDGTFSEVPEDPKDIAPWLAPKQP